MNQTAMLTRFVTDTDIDTVLVAGRYTLLDKSASPVNCCPRRSNTACRTSAGESSTLGVLAAPVAGKRLYDYHAAPNELIERARRLAETCARFGVPLRAAAARFPLSHPAVASVLIGVRSAAEVADALTLRALDIPAGLWDSLAFADES